MDSRWNLRKFASFSIQKVAHPSGIKLQLSAKYQLCAIHTADTTDGESPSNPRKSIVSEKVHRLYSPHSVQVLCQTANLNMAVRGLHALSKVAGASRLRVSPPITAITHFVASISAMLERTAENSGQTARHDTKQMSLVTLIRLI